MSGGIIVDDFTGDGLLDVFYSTKDPTQGCALFVNRGDGTFEDRSARAGLEPQVGALNCNHADYDNDGDLDVLLLRGGWETPRRPSLLRNEGDGRFTDVTVAAGLCEPIASQAAAWADFDCDGHVDLYIAGEFKPKNPDPRNRGRLYRNNGDGTFTDVADSAGVRNDRFGKGVAWGDYDDDGRPDLYVSNLGQANRLYHNNGDGTFTDVAERLGVTEPNYSFSCWFWDYDNDGRLDIFVTGSRATLAEIILSQLGRPTGGERPRLYHNEGGRFTDVTREAGLDRVWLPMGSNFGDIDNDGFLDFYLGTGSPPYSYLVPNVLMHNVGGRRFEDVTIASGTGHLQKGHGISFADWDRDGDVDLFLESGGAVPGDKAHNVLFENPGHGNRWLTLRLVGTRSNRAAIGARVRVGLSGPDGRRSIHRVIGGGSSFGNNPLTPTIGLGRAEAIDAVEIIWPDGGTRQVVRGLPLDRAVEITEGREGFRLLDWAPTRGRGCHQPDSAMIRRRIPHPESAARSMRDTTIGMCAAAPLTVAAGRLAHTFPGRRAFPPDFRKVRLPSPTDARSPTRLEESAPSPSRRQDGEVGVFHSGTRPAIIADIMTIVRGPPTFAEPSGGRHAEPSAASPSSRASPRRPAWPGPRPARSERGSPGSVGSS